MAVDRAARRSVEPGRGGRRGGGDRDRGGGHVSGPDQHRPLLVPAQLVHRDDFLLEDLQQVIVQVELDFERTIRDTSATPQHLQCLLQDLVTGGTDLIVDHEH